MGIGMVNVPGAGNGYVSKGSVGQAGGVAPLDASGRVASAYLPDSVKNLLPCTSYDAFPETGNPNTLYIDTETSKLYYWNGSQYMPLSGGSGGENSISEAVITMGEPLVYNGEEQQQRVDSVTLNGTELKAGTDYVSVIDTGTNAGTYQAAVFGVGAYSGVAGTTWTIAKKPLTAPTLSGSYTYDGGAKTVTVSDFDAETMLMTGDSTADNAGTYTVSFALNDTTNYQWADGTNTVISREWTIEKAEGAISVEPASLKINGLAGTTATAGVTTSNSGDVTAVSSNTGIVTVSVSGKTVTCTTVDEGTATVTLSVPEDENHTAASCTLAVETSLLSTVLRENDWQTISAATEAGIDESMWDVGDTKPIVLNGKVGNTTFSSFDIDVFILSFNHNSAKEGTNRIHWQLGKIGGKMVGLCDSNYNSSSSSSSYFQMNAGDTNSGGWNSSSMRKTLLGNSGTPDSPVSNSLMAALPSDLLAVMKSVNKYTDNTGGATGSVASNVTVTADFLFLLAEYEVRGSRSYANSYEQNSQAQYDYYKAGNSKIAYKHNATGTAAWWWLRSPYSSYYSFFCYVYSDGSASSYGAYYSAGLLPGFTT